MESSFETPRRNRHQNNDELHLTGAISTSTAPSTSTPTNHHPSSSSQHPGALLVGRPAASSSSGAPVSPAHRSPASTMDGTPLRASATSMQHNYTRSSPAVGYDGSLGSHFGATTPNTDHGAFASPTSQKYVPNNLKRPGPSAPLGLADIRPRADSAVEGAQGATPWLYDTMSATPTNSNYLAPWALYAFDWCKWPAHNHDAGKVAIGSYLEDGHNFVGLYIPCMRVDG